MDESPLSTLPAELRNLIYEMSLTSDEPIQIFEVHEISSEVTVWRTPALLATCRATRQEATSIYYSRNVFQITGAPNASRTRAAYSNHCDFVLGAWLARIGVDNRSLLRKIYLDDNFYDLDEVDLRVAKCREALASMKADIDGARIFVECDLGEDEDEDEDEDEGGDGEDDVDDEDSDGEEDENGFEDGDGEDDGEDEQRYKWVSSSDAATVV